MDQQQIEEAIKSDLITAKTWRLGIVPARDYYFSILAWIFKLSLLFVAVNTLLQRFMHAAGYYLPDFSLQVIALSWIFALLVSIFMSFTAARIILISKLIKGKLKTASLIKRKYLHFTLVFFLIYSLVYLVIAYALLGWMDLPDFQRASAELWFICVSLAFPQFSAFIAASVSTAFISMIELDRLGIGPLFNVLVDTLRKKDQLSSKLHIEDHE